VELSPTLVAAVLGLLEGATEFIPVSSTGHLIVAGHWLGFEGPVAATFEIFIQLGAILAVVWIYRARLLGVVAGWRTRPADRRLVINLTLAFLPAAITGFLIHGWMKEVLFTPTVVAGALVVGGIAILLIERWEPPVRVTSLDAIPYRTALGVGIAQVLSLVPGTSRSGATILGGYALGLSRPVATEFSFFLAVPIMFAATLFDLFKSRGALTPDTVPMFTVGFLVAFVSALFIVRLFLRFVAQHTFAAFAWYRIALGVLIFVVLARG
jgi:undecaprenyl-diphosphatase